MKRSLLTVAVLLAMSSTSYGQLISDISPANSFHEAVVHHYDIGGPEAGQVCNFVIPANTPSFDGENDAQNTVLILDVATCIGLPTNTPVTFNGIGWDVNMQQSVVGGWTADQSIAFGPVGGASGLYLTPGVGTTQGPEHAASPIIKFNTVPGLPDVVLPNGKLEIEFFENFDDSANVQDGQYNAPSSLQIQVTPEPATMSLLAIGALALIRRKR
jgi:hypothetical protein